MGNNNSNNNGGFVTGSSHAQQKRTVQVPPERPNRPSGSLLVQNAKTLNAIQEKFGGMRKRANPPSGTNTTALVRKQSKPNVTIQEPVVAVGHQEEDVNMGSEKRKEHQIHKDSSRSRLMSCGEGRIKHSEAEVVAIIAQIVGGLMEKNDAIASAQGYKGDIFCGACQPKITVEDYLERLIHYLTGIAEYERDTGHDQFVRSDMALRYIVMALIYIEKLDKVQGFIVCSRNIHRILITGIMIASKVVDDIQPKNSYFAQLGGVPVQELNQLESVFCSMLSFNLHVGVAEFDSSYARILAFAESSFVMTSMARQTAAAA